MSIKQQDIKLLWGRAGGLCSMCRIKLSEDKATSNEAYPFGEQAHIIADEPEGPRGKSTLITEQRNSYHNLILLCPTHHTQIDKDVHGYPVERLHMIKTEHELWLDKTRTAADAKTAAGAAVYASLIDAASEKCMFEDWQSWTSYALSTSPLWRKEWVNKIDDFRMTVLRAVWPGTLPELERALKTLAMTIQRTVHVFLEHAEPEEQAWVGIKFYKEARSGKEEYDRLLELYNRWLAEHDRLLFESTKAANWVAEVVRRDVNPMFFVTAGKFMVSYGPGMSGSYTFGVPEYTQEEKAEQPARIMEQLKALREEDRKREKEMFG